MQLLNTLYVTLPDSYLRLDNDTLRVQVDDETKLRVPLHMSRTEYFAMRLSRDPSLNSWEYRAYFRQAGLTDEQVEGFAQALSGFAMHSPPAMCTTRPVSCNRARASRH